MSRRGTEEKPRPEDQTEFRDPGAEFGDVTEGHSSLRPRRWSSSGGRSLTRELGICPNGRRAGLHSGILTDMSSDERTPLLPCLIRERAPRSTRSTIVFWITSQQRSSKPEEYDFFSRSVLMRLFDVVFDNKPRTKKLERAIYESRSERMLIDCC